MLHLPALTSLPSVTVVGACDLDEGRRARAERWNVPLFSEFGEMLERTAPDVVVVATPPQHHVDACLRAFDTGAHVVCEKPLAMTIADGRRILAAARQAGRHLAVNHEFRQMGIAEAVLSRIGTRGVGPAHFAQIWQSMDLPPWKEPGWRGQLSRGVLFEAGIHLVDYALAIFGERPVAVTCATSTCGVRPERTDSVALVTLEFEGGRMAHVTQNRLSPGDTRYFEATVDCADATLRASFGGRARFSAGFIRSSRPHVRFEYGPSGVAWKEVGARRYYFARNPKDVGMHATKRLLDNTFAAFASSSMPPASGEAGLLSLEVIAACYRSAERGGRVFLDQRTIEELVNTPIGS